MSKQLQVVVHRVDYVEHEFSTDGIGVVAGKIGYTISATVSVNGASMTAEFHFSSSDMETTNGRLDPEKTVRKFIQDIAVTATE